MGFGYCSSAVLRLMAFDSNTLNVNEKYTGMYERRKGRDPGRVFPNVKSETYNLRSFFLYHITKTTWKVYKLCLHKTEKKVFFNTGLFIF